MKYLLLLVAVATAQGWTRVGTITSDSDCPTGLVQLTAGGRNLCRKTVNIGCSLVTFSTNGVSYSQVRGRVYGFQKGTPGAFNNVGAIDGVSITHGSPRQHIWTMAATTSLDFCPCSSSTPVPSFIGMDYFCDVSGNTYSSADRLWDKQGCLAGAGLCCAKGNWFYKDLPQATTDDIEFRLCTDQNRVDADVYIEEVKIDIQ